MENVVYESGVVVLTDELKIKMLTRDEFEAWEKMNDDEKRKVLETLELETMITVSFSFGAPLSTLRMMAKACDVSINGMPEEARLHVARVRDFFLDVIKHSIEENKAGICPECGEKHGPDGETVH